jgi:hypothetical protein
MKTIALLSAGVAAMIVPLLPAAPAQALELKTFVASTGSGAACTRVAPCNNFANAEAAAAVGGEINCLDSGPIIGGTNFTKSITIDCAGVAASTDILGVNGAGIIVRIRNLTFSGAIGSGAGIVFTNGAALFVENCLIQNYNVGSATGISFVPASVTAKLYVSDSVISNNGLAASGGGIVIQPSGSGSARVVLNRVQVENNFQGVLVDGTGSTGVILVDVRDSVVAHNRGHGIAAISSAGHSPTGIIVDRTSSTLNAASGILAQGAVVHVGNSTVTGNALGFNAASGGQILSYQSNQVSGNFTDGAPTGVLTLK